MACTVRDLVRDAFIDSGVIGTGATPAANEAADAVRTLNRILDGFALEGLAAPGMRALSVTYPAGAEFVEFVRGAVLGSWQISVPEIVMRPSLVAVENPRREIPYMDLDDFFARSTINSGYAYAWHWEDMQSPRLFLADPPSADVPLSVLAPCDQYRDVDLNTDITAWRVGLRPLLCASLGAELARQNGMDGSALSISAARAMVKYKRSVRVPLSMQLDGSAPGVCGPVCDILTGNWM